MESSYVLPPFPLVVLEGNHARHDHVNIITTKLIKNFWTVDVESGFPLKGYSLPP